MLRGIDIIVSSALESSAENAPQKSAEGVYSLRHLSLLLLHLQVGMAILPFMPTYPWQLSGSP